MQKKSLHAYTLIEIVVVVSLIALLGLVGSNLNFNRLTQKQETSIEIVRIKSIFDEVRNAAFFGRAVGNGDIIPASWKIEISQNGSGAIKSSYMSGAWIDSGKNWTAKIPYEIAQISCAKLGNTSTGIIAANNTGTLIFTGAKMSLQGCSDANHKILTIEVKNREYKEFLEINAVTGVIRSYEHR